MEKCEAPRCYNCGSYDLIQCYNCGSYDLIKHTFHEGETIVSNLKCGKCQTIFLTAIKNIKKNSSTKSADMIKESNEKNATEIA